MDMIQAPKSLTKPLFVPYKTLMGPGPSNCSPRVLQAMSQPVLGHLSPECLEIMDQVKDGIKYVFQTDNKLTLALSTSGHGGMEAVMCNLLEKGDKVLVAENGLWGQRAATMAARYGAQVITINAEPGTNFTLVQLENAISAHRPVLLFITQGESSTGVYQPIEGIGDICRRFNCLLSVDAVASLGGVPMYADKWAVDAIYTGSQKVLGAPPGLTPISFSARAQNRIFNRKTPVKVYYLDMTVLGDYWNCFGNPRTYHHTGSSSLLCGLREGLALIASEGLNNLIERHRTCAQHLYEGLQRIGLQLYVDDEYKRLPTITAVLVPEGIHWRDIVAYANKRYGLEISGGLGPTANQIFRIGLMGYNCNIRNVNFVVKVLKEAIDHCYLIKARL